MCEVHHVAPSARRRYTDVLLPPQAQSTPAAHRPGGGQEVNGLAAQAGCRARGCQRSVPQVGSIGGAQGRAGAGRQGGGELRLRG